MRVARFPDGVVTGAGSRVVYDVVRDEAHFGAASVDGDAIVWEVDERPEGEWLVRCDRVDFPPGGVAYLHTHPGPGIRVLLEGSIRIDSAGRVARVRAGGVVVRERAGARVRRGVGGRADGVRARDARPARARGAANDPVRRSDRRREAELQRARIYFEHRLA